MATVRRDRKAGYGNETVAQFIRRFNRSGQRDDVIIARTLDGGRRKVIVGNARLYSDEFIPGGSDENVQAWAAAKALYAATNILLELGEDVDAQQVERLARKCWARTMRTS